MSAGPHPAAAPDPLAGMHLSIVIPAFNEEKLLPATLAAVARASLAFAASGLTHEVIVCDNNSTDDTAALARARGAAVIFEPENQISRARNTGATLATGDWILFLDADSRPSFGLFSELAATLHDATVLYGGCPLEFDSPAGAARLCIALWHRLAVWRHWAAGSFLFVRRDAFVESGGFSRELYASEEIELSHRLAVIARRRRQGFAWLSACPLETSARKLHFHTAGHHLRFALRTIVTRGRTLQHRDACGIWYDGRR